MSIKIFSSTFSGIDGVIVSVEIDINRGLPAFNIVGLANTPVRESRERVHSAIINSGFQFPLGKITVNLAPADVPKEGALLDLPIALGILLATYQVQCDDIKDFIIIGELSLNGDIKSIKGALPIIIEGINNGITKFIVPTDNAKECSAVQSAEIYPFDTLKQVADFIQHKDMLPYRQMVEPKKKSSNLDFSDIIGQKACKRALEIACAGGHNAIIIGPPGCGKSMLASRIPSILPDLTYDEALEITKIYSIVGKLDENNGIIFERPFRSPHHSATTAALIGGGSKLLPGEITLSHHGVLFLDELLEFKRNLLNLLREPLESKSISISRNSGTVIYPANFMLIGALNPCPCGYYLSDVKECTCTDNERLNYINKLSGPFIDRIDIFTFARQHKYEEMCSQSQEETSAAIKIRVERARQLQRERFKGTPILQNADMDGEALKKFCHIRKDAKNNLEKYFRKFPFSMRTYNRILKISRTIADLDGSEQIKTCHIIEAINYRQFMNGNAI